MVPADFPDDLPDTGRHRAPDGDGQTAYIPRISDASPDGPLAPSAGLGATAAGSASPPDAGKADKAEETPPGGGKGAAPDPAETAVLRTDDPPAAGTVPSAAETAILRTDEGPAPGATAVLRTGTRGERGTPWAGRRQHRGAGHGRRAGRRVVRGRRRPARAGCPAGDARASPHRRTSPGTGTRPRPASTSSPRPHEPRTAPPHKPRMPPRRTNPGPAAAPAQNDPAARAPPIDAVVRDRGSRMPTSTAPPTGPWPRHPNACDRMIRRRPR